MNLSLLLASLIFTSTVVKDTSIVQDSIVVQDTTPARPFLLKDFLHKIAKKESGNKPTAVNRFGFLGKYQFHITTIRGVGIRTTRLAFLHNEELQDTVMLRYMDQNRSELGKYIRQYAGKRFNGVNVTESGILAAGHLAGSTKVARYFRTGRDIRDANGASITMYMKQFGGYTLTNYQ